jgi:hypothetical protein
MQIQVLENDSNVFTINLPSGYRKRAAELLVNNYFVLKSKSQRT